MINKITAREWLHRHGYKRHDDGTWSKNGHVWEQELEIVLGEWLRSC